MKIHWDNIKWETDDAGTSWATLADEEHNSLTLENRDGTITFHTDGNPRFDASTVLDLTVLFVVLSRDAMGQPTQAIKTTPTPAGRGTPSPRCSFLSRARRRRVSSPASSRRPARQLTSRLAGPGRFRGQPGGECAGREGRPRRRRPPDGSG